MRGVWRELPDAVGAIDATSHRIYRPQTENQADYYSGHRHYHCLHTQIVIDYALTIRHISSGFLGRNNDAQTFRLMETIGPGQQLDFPRNAYLLGDMIYPSRHPIVTPYSAAQITRQPHHMQRQSRHLNTIIRARRVYVEHVIHLLKIFRILGTLYRHQRRHLASIVNLCAGLAVRRTKLFFS